MIGYERCSYGTYYYFCNTGSCCKISGTWYCTSITVSLSDCDSFAHTTTTTTEAPITDEKRIYETVASIVFVALIAVAVVYYIRYKKKHNHPSPVVRSTTIAVIYKA